MPDVRLTRPTALVLVALSRGQRHGFDILDATGLPSGTVYPILRRLETAGVVKSRWEAVQRARDEGRPPRRYYELTGAGAEALREALERHPDARASLAPAGARAGVPSPRPA
jgi:PadR family transcriptional regulator, regulatory protein PadR